MHRAVFKIRKRMTSPPDRQELPKPRTITNPAKPRFSFFRGRVSCSDHFLCNGASLAEVQAFVAST